MPTKGEALSIHLDNGCRALLRQVGESDDDLNRPVPVLLSEPITEQPFLYFGFVEICGGASKVSGALTRKGLSVAPILDLSHSRHHDLTSKRLVVLGHIHDWRRSFQVIPCSSPLYQLQPGGSPCCWELQGATWY